MSKVFVALALDQDDSKVVGVYRTYERARSEAEKYIARTPGWSAPIADIEEHELED